MFPLCLRPGSLAVLDDDPVFLAVFQAQLSARWNVVGFEGADQLLAHLESDQPFWEADVWLQQELVSKWRAGRCPLAKGVVDYWRRQTERFACTRICLVDYRLQDRTGLDVLRNVGRWQGRKVLVTGTPDAKLPVRASNSGLIDGFLAKSGASLVPQVAELVDRFQAEPDGRLQRLWRDTLSGEQLEALERPGVVEAVRAMLGAGVMEYVVLSDPFGVLCLDGEGSLGWLPLSLGAEIVSDCALREALELSHSHGQQATALPVAHSGLRGAFFRVPVAYTEIELPLGYSGWLQRQRAIRAHHVGNRTQGPARAENICEPAAGERGTWWAAGASRSETWGARRWY